MSPQEEGLVIRAQNRDEEAFEGLYNFYVSSVKGVVRRLLNNWEAIDDVVQEIFFAVWSKLLQGEPKSISSFPAWLMTVARNKAIDQGRRYGRTHEVGGLDSELLTVEANVDIEDVICREEAWSRAWERANECASSSLDLALKCLLLHLFGFLVEEITLILSITLAKHLSKDSVPTYLSNARRALRQALWETQQQIPFNDNGVSRQKVTACQEKSGWSDEEETLDSDCLAAKTEKKASADPWGMAWKRLRARARESSDLDLSLKCLELYSEFSCTEIALILRITQDRFLPENDIRARLSKAREEWRRTWWEILQDIKQIDGDL